MTHKSIQSRDNGMKFFSHTKLNILLLLLYSLQSQDLSVKTRYFKLGKIDTERKEGR